ncbi:MAG: response regulator [bacterium]|nr:response regulator [bacterium]
MSSEAKPRILVIDDDPALQKLVSTLLERSGMSVMTATNATEAAQILKARPLPDAIVLDLMLPDISGIEFLRQMRQREAYQELPVLILSALADPEKIREGLSVGADRYLTKPYLGNNLVPTMQDLLRTGRKK